MLKIFFKKFGYIIALFVIAVVAAINMNVSTNKYGLSDRQLTNIEALARNEGSGDCKWHQEKCSATCWYCSPTFRETCLEDGDGNNCDCGETSRPCP